MSLCYRVVRPKNDFFNSSHRAVQTEITGPNEIFIIFKTSQPLNDLLRHLAGGQRAAEIGGTRSGGDGVVRRLLDGGGFGFQAQRLSLIHI